MPRRTQQPLSQLGDRFSGPTGHVIQFSQDYFRQLQRIRDELFGKPGVRFAHLSDKELLDRVRCDRCGARCKKNCRKNQKHRDETKNQAGNKTPPGTADDPNDVVDDKVDKLKEPMMRCKFHDGQIRNKHWTCCGKFASQPGCRQAEHHTPQDVSLEYLSERFQIHSTYEAVQPSGQHRHAVAIDCEMGTSKDFEPEVIRLTVIDYFTSEILIDSLVWPDVPILHYNTRYSGITRQQMRDAQRARRCIMGVSKARELVWKYVGPATLVVGHSLSSDLGAMRWLHRDIVDSFLIEQELWNIELRRMEAEERKKKDEELAAASDIIPSDENTEVDEDDVRDESDKVAQKETEKKKGNLSLKSLAEKRLGIKVQVGTAGHDSVEDALTARDLVHWHVRQRLENESHLPEAAMW